jgi:hypothetical protein
MVGRLFASDAYQEQAFGEVRMAPSAPWARWAYGRACERRARVACRALETMEEGPVSPAGLIDPAYDPLAAPAELDEPVVSDSAGRGPGRRSRRSTNAFGAPDRPWRGLAYYASGGSIRSWSTATQASVIRIGVTVLGGPVGGGFEIDTVTDSRWHPKYDRTYQRWLFRGHAAFQLELRPDMALVFGIGGAAGSYRNVQDAAVFSAGLLQFIQLDMRLYRPGILLAMRIGQQQLFQSAPDLPADHVTGLSLIVGRIHDL